MNTGVGDPITVITDRLHQQVSRADERFAVRGGGVAELLQLLGPLVTALQHLLGEIAGEVIVEVIAVDVDRLVGPLASESELAPGANVLLRSPRGSHIPFVASPTTGALRAEYPIELGQRQLTQRIVLVDEHHERECPAGCIERPRRHGDLDGRAVEHPLKSLKLVPRRAPPHCRHIGTMHIQRGHPNERTLQVVLELHIRVVPAESLLEVACELAIGQIVGSPVAQCPGQFSDGLVSRQAAQIELPFIAHLACLALEPVGPRVLQRKGIL